MQLVKVQPLIESITQSPTEIDMNEILAGRCRQLYQDHPAIQPNRKHLARNYAQLLIEVIDSNNFQQPEIAQYVKVLLKAVESIQQLADVFLQCIGFVEFLETWILPGGALIDRITSSERILPDERLAMLQSYQKFLFGLGNPDQFVSFTDETKFFKLNRFINLASRCYDMEYRQILREMYVISSEILEVSPPKSQHTKHITQLWLNRIKGCLTEPTLQSFFRQHVDQYPFREIIDRLTSSRKVKLHTFKAFLAYPEIQNYVMEHLIRGNVIIKDILEDTRMDVRTKLTLIEKYPIFLAALEDPDSLRSWRNKSDRLTSILSAY